MKMLATTFVSLFAAAAMAAPYEMDPAHSEIGFSVKHLMISNVKGKFDKFTGVFDYDAKKNQLKDVHVSIDTASINTANGKRDEHLRSGDFFDVTKFPKITFKASKIDGVAAPGKTFKVTGDLTIRDKTKKVTLDFTNNGEMEFMGVKKVAFTAVGQIKRSDFGLTWNKALESGGVVVGDDVGIHLEGEADQKTAKK